MPDPHAPDGRKAGTTAEACKAGTRLAGRRALITGAGSGIGRESALLFAAEGARLACADLHADTAEATAAAVREAGGDACAIAADVRDDASVAAMVKRAESALGGLDVLFNNAGASLPGDAGVEDTPLEVWQQAIAVNLTGVFLCCRHGIPALLRARETGAPGGGSVVNMASMVAFIGAATPQIAYTAAKGGVVSMSRELAVVYARRRIRVNALCPGPVRTPLTDAFFDTPAKLERRRVHMPMGRFGETAEIARVAAFLASDEASYVNGAAWLVDGGITGAYVTPE